MTWREKIRNPFVQQYIIEIAFPLIGYYFFNWSLTIIAVFYLVDFLASELAFFRRVHKISSGNQTSGKAFLFGSIFLFLICFSILILFLYNNIISIRSIQPDDLYFELITFIKEELWLLFPLVIILYQFKDTFTFYMPRRYLLYNTKKTVVYHQLLNGIMLVLIVIGITLWRYTNINDTMVLFIFLLVKLGFDFTIVKWADTKAKK